MASPLSTYTFDIDLDLLYTVKKIVIYLPSGPVDRQLTKDLVCVLKGLFLRQMEFHLVVM